jgi:hypothetical protein
MTTLLKIRGLDRSVNVKVGSGVAGQDALSKGFRVQSAQGSYYPSGTSAFEVVGTVGAPNAAVVYAAKNGGAWGNNVKVVQNAPSGTTRIIAVTYASNTGFPVITITPTSTDTAATLVAAVNADASASQYVTASLVGTGASAPVASADANAVLALTQATGTTSAGTFTLTFPGFGTTTALNFGDSTATMAAAIQVAIRLNPNNATATVTGGGTALPTGPATFTFGATGGANLSFPTPTIDNSALTGGTYGAAYTTYGRAAAGNLNGGLNVGTAQAPFVLVNSKNTVVVDLDDGPTLRLLRRNSGRFVSLGQP